MLKTIKATVNINQTSAQTAGQANVNFNNDEIDVFKTLIDCTNDISRLRQFIFYVGTSCDNKNLRKKLKQLQEKLFQNILKQKESISYFFQRSLNGSRSSTQTHNSKFRDSELIRFTLTSLAYFEAMIQRLVHLTSVYPVQDKIDQVVNLGFEDSSVEDNEEPLRTEIKNEIKETDISNENPDDSCLDKREICFIDDSSEFKSYLNMVQKLIEEIELMDTNLLRFNIKTNETNDFFKNLKEMNKLNTRSRYGQRQSSLASKDSSDEEAANGATGTNATSNAVNKNKKKKHSHLKSIKNSTIKEFCNRRQIIYSILIIGLLCCVIAVICGLVFGLKQ